MPTQYKIEIFDRNIDFKDMTPIGEPEISFDYLTLEGIKIVAPVIAATRGDFAHITDMSGNVVYQGIVDSYEVNKGTCSIGIKPLLSLFDIKVMYDPEVITTIEDFIAGIIAAEYVTNDDDLQNIPITITATSSTPGSLNLESDIGVLWSIITAALSAFGIVITAALSPQEKMINVTIGVHDAAVKIIEADMKNVIGKKIVIGDSFGALNKLTLVNDAVPDERITYYLHTNGTVSSVDSNRIWPVFASVERITGSDFSTVAQERAIAALTPQQYDNLIELTYSRADKLLDVDDMRVGEGALILSGESVYRSIMTGYERTSGTVTLVFGIVRVDLTKKLILQKRTSSSKPSSGTSSGSTGNVSGPESAVLGNFVAFADMTGKVLVDSSKKPTDFLGATAQASDSAKLGGMPPGISGTGPARPFIPRVGTDGVMEVGQYIDWHVTSGDGLDNKARTSIDNNGTLLHNGNTVWASNTDGPGSGLDADMVDGIHAAALVPTAKIAAGHVTGLGTASWTSVSFGKTFANIPRVVATYQQDTTGDVNELKIRNVTTTGFQITIGGSGFSGREADWIAIEA